MVIADELARAETYEREGNYAEALNVWYLLQGFSGGIIETEKDGLRIRYDEKRFASKIEELKSRIASAAGYGKVRRVPMQHQRVSGGSVQYDADGYAWGY